MADMIYPSIKPIIGISAATDRTSAVRTIQNTFLTIIALRMNNMMLEINRMQIPVCWQGKNVTRVNLFPHQSMELLSYSSYPNVSNIIWKHQGPLLVHIQGLWPVAHTSCLLGPQVTSRDVINSCGKHNFVTAGMIFLISKITGENGQINDDWISFMQTRCHTVMAYSLDRAIINVISRIPVLFLWQVKASAVKKDYP